MGDKIIQNRVLLALYVHSLFVEKYKHLEFCLKVLGFSSKLWVFMVIIQNIYSRCLNFL